MTVQIYPLKNICTKRASHLPYSVTRLCMSLCVDRSMRGGGGVGFL